MPPAPIDLTNLGALPVVPSLPTNPILEGVPGTAGTGAEQISRAGDSDAAGALKRVTGLRDIDNEIVFESALTPQDIHDRYRVSKGAIYGLASHGRFTGAFKPGNRRSDLPGLYLAGGSAPTQALPTDVRFFAGGGLNNVHVMGFDNVSIVPARVPPALAQAATQAAQAMRTALDLPESAFTYLTSHGSLDRKHVQYFATLVEQLERAEDRDAVAHVAGVVYRLYGDIFRSLSS